MRNEMMNGMRDKDNLYVNKNSYKKRKSRELTRKFVFSIIGYWDKVKGQDIFLRLRYHRSARTEDMFWQHLRMHCPEWHETSR